MVVAKVVLKARAARAVAKVLSVLSLLALVLYTPIAVTPTTSAKLPASLQSGLTSTRSPLHHGVYLPTFGVSSSTGYRLVAADGGVFDFGASNYLGTGTSGTVAAGVNSDGSGYWTVTGNGIVTALGTAKYFGDLAYTNLAKPIVGMAITPDDGGYWLVASDGGIFTFGDAGFFGSTGNIILNKPIVGMASSPDGKGYWLVASDGGIFTFGDAGFFGSTGSMNLAQPIVAIIDFAPPPPPAPPTPTAPPQTTSGPATQPLTPVSTISNSRNWSGYILSNNAPYGYSSITGTFNIPSSISCDANGYAMMAQWVGLGGWDTSSIIQAGVNCGPDGLGGVSESAWLELYPAGSVNVPLNVNFGDTVTVTINNTTGNLWSISYKDATSGSTYSTTVNYAANGANDTAEWIVEVPTSGNHLTTLAPFSPSVTFTNLSWISTAPSGSVPTAYATNIASSGVIYDTTTVDTTNRKIVITYS